MRGPPSLWGQFSPPDLFRSISHSDLRAEARLGRGPFSNRRPERGPDGFETNRRPHPLPSAAIRHPLAVCNMNRQFYDYRHERSASGDRPGGWPADITDKDAWFPADPGRRQCSKSGEGRGRLTCGRALGLSGHSSAVGVNLERSAGRTEARCDPRG